jgi:predicted TIM-barrel fold metal-dependent hydrolase
MTTPTAEALPKIISVDDHILEPRTLWQEELPADKRDRGPKVVREKLKLHFSGGHYGFERNAPDGKWCDLWIYDDLVLPTGLLHAAAGVPKDKQENVPAIYEDFREATYDQKARLADMDTNHVEVALNYPNTFPRFAGQGFAERPDKDLSLRCLQIYNDWMIESWCGGDGRGRLIPLTLVPLWDPQAAAAEVRRCAAKGSYAIAFSENPSKLGFPSLYTGAWDVLWDACMETGTTVSMHIG